MSAQHYITVCYSMCTELQVMQHSGTEQMRPRTMPSWLCLQLWNSTLWW